jgi:hypothetical protein
MAVTAPLKLGKVSSPCVHEGPCSRKNECPCLLRRLACERECLVSGVVDELNVVFGRL